MEPRLQTSWLLLPLLVRLDLRLHSRVAKANLCHWLRLTLHVVCHAERIASNAWRSSRKGLDATVTREHLPGAELLSSVPKDMFEDGVPPCRSAAASLLNAE